MFGDETSKSFSKDLNSSRQLAKQAYDPKHQRQHLLFDA